MEKRSFRFYREYFIVEGKSIEFLIIQNGHGYEVKTCCCRNCGELFTLDQAYLYYFKTTLPLIAKNLTCPKCDNSLSNNLLDYPEFVVVNGNVLKNPSIENSISNEDTEIIECYHLT